MARAVPSELPAWRPVIERALFEHYTPYAEAAAADVPALGEPASVWAHTRVDYVQVGPLDGPLTVEIGYRVAWDEEHTLGARLRDGRLVELNGSVLAP
jgi:hypothetical protein